MNKSTCDCVYDTANRLADDASRQKKVTIQNAREVLKRGGASSNQSKKIKHKFSPKLFCDESQGNVAETLLHPI